MKQKNCEMFIRGWLLRSVCFFIISCHVITKFMIQWYHNMISSNNFFYLNSTGKFKISSFDNILNISMDRCVFCVVCCVLFRFQNGGIPHSWTTMYIFSSFVPIRTGTVPVRIAMFFFPVFSRSIFWISNW
jgi:hypothetical protein